MLKNSPKEKRPQIGNLFHENMKTTYIN
jgi:hypothetical protein